MATIRLSLRGMPGIIVPHASHRLARSQYRCDVAWDSDRQPTHDTPLTNLVSQVDSIIPGGTSSTIVCDRISVPTNAGGDASLSLSNLPPGTHQCTITIGP